MSLTQVLGRAIFAAVVIKECKQVCKASELPLYEKDGCQDNVVVCTPKPSAVENAVGSIRRQLWDVKDQLTVYQTSIKETVNQGEEYVSSMFKYLSTEADDTTKMAAIGAGAVTGFVLGLRGGIIRKVFYSGIGAYGMSAICYPQETQKYTREFITEARKNSTIAYNFVVGTKGDPLPSLPQLPEFAKLPSSMDEVWEIARSIGNSASSLIPDYQSLLGKDASADKKVKNEVMSSSDELVKQSHEASIHSECHCPVGACLGRHDPQNPPPS